MRSYLLVCFRSTYYFIVINIYIYFFSASSCHPFYTSSLLPYLEVQAARVSAAKIQDKFVGFTRLLEYLWTNEYIDRPFSRNGISEWKIFAIVCGLFLFPHASFRNHRLLRLDDNGVLTDVKLCTSQPDCIHKPDFSDPSLNHVIIVVRVICNREAESQSFFFCLRRPQNNNSPSA